MLYLPSTSLGIKHFLYGLSGADTTSESPKNTYMSQGKPKYSQSSGLVYDSKWVNRGSLAMIFARAKAGGEVLLFAGSLT